MKAEVDKELCIGCGLCVQICPEIFEMPGDKAVVRDVAIDVTLEGKCTQAADDCPVNAIKIGN